MPTKTVKQERKTPKTSKPTLKQLEDTIATLNKELKEKSDKLLRSYAEQQNQQKRLEKELQIKELHTKTKYLLELLDIHELLKKAYQDSNPKQGLKLLLQNLEKFLTEEDIEYIDCKGKKFDHELHHAVSVIEQADCEDNTIIDEIKKGYKKGEILLRPSHVVVSKLKNENHEEIKGE